MQYATAIASWFLETVRHEWTNLLLPRIMHGSFSHVLTLSLFMEHRDRERQQDQPLYHITRDTKVTFWLPLL